MLLVCRPRLRVSHKQTHDYYSYEAINNKLAQSCGLCDPSTLGIVRKAATVLVGSCCLESPAPKAPLWRLFPGGPAHVTTRFLGVGYAMPFTLLQAHLTPLRLSEGAGDRCLLIRGDR